MHTLRRNLPLFSFLERTEQNRTELLRTLEENETGRQDGWLDDARIDYLSRLLYMWVSWFSVACLPDVAWIAVWTSLVLSLSVFLLCSCLSFFHLTTLHCRVKMSKKKGEKRKGRKREGCPTISLSFRVRRDCSHLWWSNEANLLITYISLPILLCRIGTKGTSLFSFLLMSSSELSFVLRSIFPGETERYYMMHVYPIASLRPFLCIRSPSLLHVDVKTWPTKCHASLVSPSRKTQWI